MEDGYHEECKDCENLYHCFGPDTADRIKDDNTEDLKLHPWHCTDYYPEVAP